MLALNKLTTDMSVRSFVARLPPDPPSHSQQSTDRKSSGQQQQARGNINECVDTVTAGQAATPQAFNSCPVSKQQMDKMSVEELQKALQIVGPLSSL
jgi:hypothetical protein